jgi:hypothetical protein
MSGRTKRQCDPSCRHLFGPLFTIQKVTSPRFTILSTKRQCDRALAGPRHRPCTSAARGAAARRQSAVPEHGVRAFGANARTAARWRA